MARLLAEAGHDVLRFDFSGIGDSQSRGGSPGVITAFKADVAEAIDLLTETCGPTQIVLIGLCSGADVALRYGFVDERVAGLVLLDPGIPPTVRFYTDYILRRISRLPSWLSFAVGRGRIWQDVGDFIRTTLTAKPSMRPNSLIDPQRRGELGRMYMTFVARGGKLLVVLTGGPLEGRQSYREQLLDAFPNVPFANKLAIEHFATSDHTFTSAQDRERLNSIVLTWIDQLSRTSAALSDDESRGRREA
jgi:pimeloyl-ACP methyl ester carboxylesterase